MKRSLIIIIATAACVGSFTACSQDADSSDDAALEPIALSVGFGTVAEPQVSMRGCIAKGATTGTVTGMAVSSSATEAEWPETAMRGVTNGTATNGGYTFQGDEVMYVSVLGKSGSTRSTVTPEVAKYTVGNGTATASTNRSLTYAGTGTVPYWLTSAETITVRAWADGTTSTTATDPNGQTFAIETTQSGTHVKELLYAAPADYSYSANKNGLNVPLYHQTARLIVNVLSEESSLTVTGVQIGTSTNKVPTQATFTAPTAGNTIGSWSAQGTADVITARAETTASVTNCKATYSAVVIPYDGTSGASCYQADHEMVSITTNEGGETKTYVYKLGSAVNIQAGRQYTLTLTLQSGGGGFVSGAFAISASASVYFSQGNLQATYDGSSWTWAFAEHQWDYIGDATKTATGNGNTSINGNGTVSANNVTVDLFGWVGNSNTTWSGTNGSGTQGEASMHGISNSTTTNNASHYGNKTGNDGETLKSDWGNVSITNGEGKSWRSLTSAEWQYIFNSRTGTGQGSTVNGTEHARYCHATINTDGTGVNGMILFPDGVTFAAGDATTWGTINGNSSWGTQCTTAQWSKLESKGCVFLPAAGSRNGTTVSHAGTYGYYWSSTAYPTSARYACRVYFYSGNLYPADYNNRYYGNSVRLVRSAE